MEITKKSDYILNSHADNNTITKSSVQEVLSPFEPPTEETKVHSECNICFIELSDPKDFTTMKCCGITVCNNCLELWNKQQCPNCNKSTIKPKNSFFKTLNKKCSDYSKTQMNYNEYECQFCHQKFQKVSLPTQNNNINSINYPSSNNIHICQYCQQQIIDLQTKKSILKQQFASEERVNIIFSVIFSHVQAIKSEIYELNHNNNQLNINYKKTLYDLNESMRFRFCPYCMTPLLKDNKCEHIDCNVCDLSLCFTCVAPRIPILEHSMSCYHREGCRFYQPLQSHQIKEFKKNCPACQKKGSACDLPSSWEQYQQLVKDMCGGELFFTPEFAFNWIQEND